MVFIYYYMSPRTRASNNYWKEVFGERRKKKESRKFKENEKKRKNKGKNKFIKKCFGARSVPGNRKAHGKEERIGELNRVYPQPFT